MIAGLINPLQAKNVTSVRRKETNKNKRGKKGFDANSPTSFHL